MSTEEQQNGSTGPEMAPEERPGALLKTAREAAKLSEEDVARELRMTVSKVRALEADDFDQLHSDTFIRGYLRTYSKLLGLEPDDLLKAYQQARRQAGLGDEPEESPLQINVPEPTRSLWKFVVWIIILLAGIWALSVWFLGNRQDPAIDSAQVDPMPELSASARNPAESAESKNEGLDTEATTPTDVDAVPDEDPTDTGAVSGTPSDVGQTDAAAMPVNGAVEPLAATEVASPAASLSDPEVLDQLRMSFSEECWVEVTDSRGDVLETDLLQPGRELLLSGEAPFTLKLGNAAAVLVELNGEPFEFVPPASGRTMTLTVN